MINKMPKKVKDRVLKFVINEGGFTLLELMISFAIIAIIVVIILGAMRLGLHSVDSGEKRIDSIERIRRSVNIIDSQIQSQIPLTFEENAEKKYYFQGSRDSIQFPTNYSIWGGLKGYVVVKYKVESDNTGKQMLVAYENVIGINNIRETKLFNALDAIYFEYFFKDPTEEKGSWVESWTDSLNIPEKIRMHIRYEGKDISMIIPMRTTGSIARQTSK